MICSTSSNNLLSNSAETQAIKWSLHCLQHMALYTCSSGFERSSYLLLNDVEELLRICGRKSCRTSLEKYFPLFFSLYTTMCSIETPTIPTFGAVVHRIRSFDSKKMRKCVGLPQNSSSSEWKGLLFITASTITAYELDAFLKASWKCEFQQGTGVYWSIAVL